MKLRQAILATAIAALTTVAAEASLITWGAAQNIAGNSDVSTTGTFIDAINLGTGGSPSVHPTTIVNGVTFTQFDAFSGSTPTFSIAGVGGASSFTVGAGAFAALPVEYRDLLRAGANDADFTLTMSGLDLGATYQVQFWSNFSTTSAAGSTLTASTGASTVTLDTNVSNGTGGLGQYVLGTFAADSTSQVVSFASSGSGAVLNGAQLRQLAPAAVPEPGTAMAGLALAGCVGLRRRRTPAPASR